MKMTEQVFREMLSHAEAQAPIEACGYLAAKDGVAVESVPLTNADNSPEHFSLDPAEQFAAARKIRENGMQLRAVYHSHPATPARPSAEDIRLAFDPELSYVIVSLAASAPDIKCFSIRNRIVTPEQIEIVRSRGEASNVL